MNSFESTLLTELREHVATRAADQPARRRRVRRLTWSAVPVGAAAAATAVALVLVQSPAAAYAVTRADDGDVVVTIDKLSDAAGLQQALQTDGINAVVNYDANLTLPPPPAPPGGQTSSESGSSSSSSQGPTLTTSNPPAQSSSGVAADQSGCGSVGPVQVAVSPSSVTFTIPSQDVGTGSTLYITTGGSQTGFSALRFRWQC